jgi:hypothetical protein
MGTFRARSIANERRLGCSKDDERDACRASGNLRKSALGTFDWQLFGDITPAIVRCGGVPKFV